MQPLVGENYYLKRDKDDAVMYAILPITALTLDRVFISSHMLVEDSYPTEWLRSFVPTSKVKGVPPHQFCTEK